MIGELVTTTICNMKTALVTGHLGFIGQHLWRALHANDEYVPIGLDIKNGPHEDIRTCVLPPADICFHLAAQTKALSTDTLEDADINIMGTVRILEKYRENVVFATSRASIDPTVPYSISKHACEYYCDMYKARMVRMCNVTGEGGHGVIEAFTRSDTLRIVGSGSIKRAYAPVQRAVELFLIAANSLPGSLHILRGPQLTVLEIAELFFPNKPRIFVKQDPRELTINYKEE